MRLSKIEFLAMNNPIRRFVQKHLEFKIFKGYLKKHNINLENKVILDAGCGSGYSTQLILDEFNPSKLVAFDYMPEQIRLALKRNLKANFFVGDLTNIISPNNTYDAVFIFGVVHHIPEWKKALSEVYRVLKPNGVFLIEELNKTVINIANPLGFYHPEEAKFSWQEFKQGLITSGFRILEDRNIILSGMKSFLCIKSNNTK